MNMAGADAHIASWAIKKKYGFWRPVTAIRIAVENPDPNWEPLLNTPAHPEYVSGHCIYSGAAARVLQQLFGDDGVKFSATFGGPNGVTRQLSRLCATGKGGRGSANMGRDPLPHCKRARHRAGAADRGPRREAPPAAAARHTRGAVGEAYNRRSSGVDAAFR
jgi:hypothetical protein